MTGYYLEQKANEAERRETEEAAIRAARVELWLEYRAARHAGDPVSPSGLRRVGQELGLC
jgi:hypothetical protein